MDDIFWTSVMSIIVAIIFYVLEIMWIGRRRM